MTYYGLSGKFVANPGKRDELVAILLQAADILRSNKGCIHYLISTTEEPNDIWVTETWTDKAAHDASLDPEDIKALIRQAIPLIAGSANQTELQVVGGKGL